MILCTVRLKNTVKNINENISQVKKKDLTKVKITLAVKCMFTDSHN